MIPNRMETWETRRTVASGEAGVVAAQHILAAEAGAEILRAGGNATDAAVACALALAVCEPWMSGLGGSGLAVIWDANHRRAVALDFQGALPMGIDIADYPLDPDEPESLMGYPGVFQRRNIRGGHAITVPGALCGLGMLHGRFGRLGFDSVAGPAIRLADAGIPVNWHATLMIAVAMGDLRTNPTAASLYLPNGLPPEPPLQLAVPALAATLRAVANDGPDAFYSERLADEVAKDLAEAGSRITGEDLAAYRSHWCESPAIPYRDATIHTAGPSSGGPRLATFLGHTETALDRSDDARTHACRTYAAALRTAWVRHRQRTGQARGEPGCTTHLSTCDAEGNMVALTSTLLNRFGSRVVLPRTGILMNNAMGYFDPRPNQPLSIAPGKRVGASNMCPVICVRDGESRFALGASGANRIVPAVAQIVSNLLDWDMDLQTALEMPRIDVAADGAVRADSRLDAGALRGIGGEVHLAERGTFPKHFACPQAVMRKGKTFEGMADPANPSAGAVAA